MERRAGTSASDSNTARSSINGGRRISISLDWGSKNRLVAVNVLNSDVPLLGGGLLHGYILLVDFEKKKLVIKEPGVEEPATPPIKKKESKK